MKKKEKEKPAVNRFASYCQVTLFMAENKNAPAMNDGALAKKY
jgi:hypothetical protein